MGCMSYTPICAMFTNRIREYQIEVTLMSRFVMKMIWSTKLSWRSNKMVIFIIQVKKKITFQPDKIWWGNWSAVKVASSNPRIAPEPLLIPWTKPFTLNSSAIWLDWIMPKAQAKWINVNTELRHFYFALVLQWQYYESEESFL